MRKARSRTHPSPVGSDRSRARIGKGLTSRSPWARMVSRRAPSSRGGRMPSAHAQEDVQAAAISDDEIEQAIPVEIVHEKIRLHSAGKRERPLLLPSSVRE